MLVAAQKRLEAFPIREEEQFFAIHDARQLLDDVYIALKNNETDTARALLDQLSDEYGEDSFDLKELSETIPAGGKRKGEDEKLLHRIHTHYRTAFETVFRTIPKESMVLMSVRESLKQKIPSLKKEYCRTYLPVR